MLTDHWIIAQLLAQLCAWTLLVKAGLSAVKQIRYWQANQRTTLQLNLERETYLVGSIAQMVLGFQFVSLVLFLATVNLHLPGMLKGAMCATGVLAMNDLGYPLLALKGLSVLVYGVFLTLNYLDEQEPGFVLTPKKYYWIFPSILLLSGDLGVSIAYFSQLSPDIIATCCSVVFGNTAQSGFFEAGLYGKTPLVLLGAFYTVGVLSILGWLKQWKPWALFLLGGAFVLLGILSLKGFFVKYIYGLPSHACLFDIFWGKYHYVGYMIFGSYYALGFSSIACWATNSVEGKLQKSTQGFTKQLKWVAVGALLLAMLLPTLYWILWKGEL